MLAIRAYRLVDSQVNAEATPDSIPPARGTRPVHVPFQATSTEGTRIPSGHAVEREFGRLKNEYGLTPLRLRGRDYQG
jgi:hypothetical protein